MDRSVALEVLPESPPIRNVVQLHYFTPTAASRLATRLAIGQHIIAAHSAELTIRRKQLTITLSYGVFDDSKWQQDVDFFVESVMISDLRNERDWDFDELQEDREIFREMIETATAHYKETHNDFSADMDPIVYEQMVADGLADLGWKTRTTQGSGDQGIDVIAEMRGQRVVIQCKRYSSAIGNAAVQEAYAGRAFASADHAAVVTNAEFTRSARQLADTTGVILLHHDELPQLEYRIFGTTSHSARAGMRSSERSTISAQSCADIVKEHADRLTILRKHLTVTCDNGMLENSQWLEEVAIFINQTIASRTAGIASSSERIKAVEKMIDAATLHYPYSRVPLLIDTTPGLYEQAVADSLGDLGWITRLTGPGEDQHFDAIAEKEGKRVMIHCTGFFPPIHDGAVEHLDQTKSLFNADYAVVVSDAGFSPSVRERASSTGVVLLRHDNLTLLDERVFGADNWRDTPARASHDQAIQSPPAKADMVVANAA